MQEMIFMFNNKIKMILLDMDGTLLNSKSKISPNTKIVLKKLIDDRYKIVIATGRSYGEAKMLTKDIPNLAYITTNGSHITDFKGEVIFNNPINHQDAVSILEIIEGSPALNYSVFSEKELIVKNKRRFFNSLVLSHGGFKKVFSIKKIINKLVMMAHASRTMPIKEVENVREFLKTELLDIQKFFIVGVGDELEAVKKQIVDKIGDRIKISSSGKNNLEINSANISKGSALRFLSEKFAISLEHTIAFGDSENDLELFDTAGISVAMGNSELESLREKADLIAESNDNEGVAKVLSRLLKG